jgi:hypothetical protein
MFKKVAIDVVSLDQPTDVSFRSVEIDDFLHVFHSLETLLFITGKRGYDNLPRC